ncbi:Ferric uptake regulator family protein [bacterium A37T11]|nr:Ferric uptake regulator family protein [bacterium A37T11]
MNNKRLSQRIAGLRIKSRITASLEKEGHLISPQRRVLIDALCEAREITNVEDFWLQLRKQHHISWSTVYSNINLLVRKGWLIREGSGVRNYTYHVVV